MAYEQKDNTWSLFKNDKKSKETQPDYNGNIMINGVKMQLSAWVKESKNGMKYFSGSVKPIVAKDSVEF